ncbi:Uncharacterized protein TPAR_03799 [Tolypocladium paradoxum]|uniref:Peroxisomal-coenzyme A synthetase n=1 Tax=Tolypocladium paradoxum TaxID=94208 RepID=A0A2S4L0P8_9HYPO|nr:Uncharacterized protein TPAR_03799 [Tolypocladium paradoxum]
MATHSNVLVLPANSESDDSPAVIHPSKGSASPPTVSYAQLAAITRSLQLDLAHAGITKASRVAIVLPNGLEFVAVFLAIVRQRGVAAPLSPQYTQSEFKDVFSRMEPELVVMLPATPDSDDGSSLAAPGVQAALELGVRVALCRRKCEAKGGVEPGLRLDLELLEVGDIAPTAAATEAIVFSRNDVWSEDKALMLFTSGTTGAPKSVLLSHTNLLVAMRIIIANHKLSPADRTFIITPLYHIIGVCGSLLVTLFSGGCVVIPESLPGAFWQQCADYGITWFHGVPTIHRLLLGFRRPGGRVPSQLRFLRCGGSEMPPDLHESLVALGPQLLEVYGMTETAPAIFCNRLTEADDAVMRRRGHYPIPDAVDVVILPSEVLSREAGDDARNGAAAAAAGDMITRLTKEPGVIGEVCLRGKNVMDGYTNSPEANAEAFLSNGYFRTGDLGAIQPDGYLRLVGRIKEVINKGGTKIGPAEVEHVALSHGSVGEAACFRIADKVYGDEIGLAVTLRPHLEGEVGPITAVDLKRHIRQHLTAFKVPKKIVFVDAIPYNRTGKPLRTQLAQRFAKGLL